MVGSPFAAYDADAWNSPATAVISCTGTTSPVNRCGAKHSARAAAAAQTSAPKTSARAIVHMTPPRLRILGARLEELLSMGLFRSRAFIPAAYETRAAVEGRKAAPFPARPGLRVTS